MRGTAIEYADDSSNCAVGCAGCELWTKDSSVRTCYAGNLVTRYAGLKGWPESFDKPKLFLSRLLEAVKWPDLRGKQRPAKDGVIAKPWLDGLPRFIFLNDLGDTFTEGLPHDWLGLPSPELKGFSPLQILSQMKAIIMVLTKRATQMRQFFERYECPRNFILMTSITGPETLNRVRELLKIKTAQWRGISAEPLLTHGLKRNWWRALETYVPELDWGATGFESGAGRRPYDIRAMYDLSEIFTVYHKPLFVKQLDKIAEVPKDLPRQLPKFTLD